MSRLNDHEGSSSPHYFKMREVSAFLGVAPSAIRFYVKQFAPHLRPRRTKTDRYAFSRRDVRVLQVILYLLRTSGLTIRQAKEKLADLLDEYKGDPFSIPIDQSPPVAPAETIQKQAESCLPSEPLSAGVREDSSPGQRAEERVAYLEQELSEASRRIAELTKELLAARRETVALAALRQRVRQAVTELLLLLEEA